MAGVPEMLTVTVGVEGGEEVPVLGACTVIAKGCNEADEPPADAVMMMLANVPTFEVLGVPVSAPVLVLKVAQTGKFCTENVAVPLLTVAVGVKL